MVARSTVQTPKTKTNNISQGWIDYMLDTCSLDVFSFDENCDITPPPPVNGCTPPVQHKLPQTIAISKNMGVDVVVCHDEFIDSLIYEQILLRENSTLMELNLSKSESTLGLNSSASTVTTTTSDVISHHSVTDFIRNRKRSRNPEVLKDKFNVDRNSRNPALISETSPLLLQAVDLHDALHTEHNPLFYLHPQCRMQKDKGKGDDPGSAICAKGSDQCLNRLREKMKLLTDHAMEVPGEHKKTPATMKRRKARISAQYDNFTETRSLIELRMGFLSMTYGVLLRWETRKSNKITLVVLRKNCLPSFYPKESNTLLNSQQINRPQEDVLKIERTKKGNESKVLLPPFVIPRPEFFDPMQLSVSVLYALGLSRKANWTVQVNYEGTVENTLLSYNSESTCFTPKVAPKFHTQIPEKANPAALEIKLFEHRIRRKNHQRLVETIKVPLSSLDVQGSLSPQPIRLCLPCKNVSEAAIQIEVLLISDYSDWVRRERESRKSLQYLAMPLKSSSSSSNKKCTNTTPTKADPVMIENMENEKENYDNWDWICCIC